MVCDPSKIVILGPQGPQGPQGISGPQGLMGPIGPAGNDLPGIIKDYAGASVPTGYLLCDGSAYSTALYPYLYAAIGTLWGDAGPGTFRVPNLMGKVTIGDGTLMTIDVTGGDYLETFTIAVSGGETRHILTLGEMPDHQHDATPYDVYDDSGTANDGPNAPNDADRTPYSGPVYGHPGYTLAHNNMQPYAVVKKIIKY